MYHFHILINSLIHFLPVSLDYPNQSIPFSHQQFSQECEISLVSFSYNPISTASDRISRTPTPHLPHKVPKVPPFITVDITQTLPLLSVQRSLAAFRSPTTTTTTTTATTTFLSCVVPTIILRL